MPNFGKLARISLALAMPTSILLIYWLYRHWSQDDEVFGPNRVITTRNTNIEILVPQRAVGAIIGRQGSNIKLIQKKTGARLHFKDRKASEDNDKSFKQTHRTIVILGSPESAQLAELMVHQVIADIPETTTEEIEVPSYFLGGLIGKGGVTIRELTKASGARIHIGPSQDYKSSEKPRVIALTGSREQIDSALELIEQKLEALEDSRVNSKRIGMTPSNKKREKIKLTPVTRDDTPWDLPKESLVPDKLADNSLLDVYVSAVEHPGHFWVQVVGKKALQLEQIQKDITAFVSTTDAKQNYTVTDIIPGELVAAPFDEGTDTTYYRAKILCETADGKVDLYFIDFGDNTFAEKEDIFKLRPDFKSFPPQAVECQLANVEPIGDSWTEEAITCFENLSYCAQWKVVSARVVSYKLDDRGLQIPLIQLTSTSEGQVI
ncbi:unnamed protein product [Lymnaea stagnalis]|uniref:Tudor and KH domain-containing protein n=1 Tax=Lymnaea stagnalis TaxID=6523 RepID=A0AAV2I2D3_LYMST